MKKPVLLIIIVVIAAATGYYLLTKKETKPVENVDAPLKISKNSSAFDSSFSKLLDGYYALKNAFVDWDTIGANQSARSLQQLAAGLPLTELKADSGVIQTAQNYLTGINGEIEGLIGEQTIEEKRNEFNIITSDLYDLIRVVKYDGEKIYHIKCTMTFKDSLEAYWLSNSNKIVNPYLGRKHPTFKDKMLGCGEIVDSLDFSKK